MDDSPLQLKLPKNARWPLPSLPKLSIPALLRPALFALTVLVPLLLGLGTATAQTISNTALVVPPTPEPGTEDIIDSDIRDIAPPVEIPSWAWLWWCIILAALIVLGVLLYKRWQKKALESAQPIRIPPHIRAKERLRKALSLIEDPRLFCGEVSDALRVYLEGQFQLRAPERTTEEFLLELQASDNLNQDQKLSLSDFLQQCDMVKFARHEPPESDLKELHESALRLIDETQFEGSPTVELVEGQPSGQPAPTAGAAESSSNVETRDAITGKKSD